MADEWNSGIAQKSLVDQEFPPLGLNFDAASSRDRLRYGFPAEPDRETQPCLWAKWERNLHRPWRRVVPQYELQPDLSGTGLVNMVAGSATVSTALDVSATVLECYYGTNQP
ncbi:MAG: hypothetical protein ACLP7J_09995 [Streptosporangiaceae bacterium]